MELETSKIVSNSQLMGQACWLISFFLKAFEKDTAEKGRELADGMPYC